MANSSNTNHNYRHFYSTVYLEIQVLKPLDYDTSTSKQVNNSFILQKGPNALTDDEVQLLVGAKHIPAYKLENILDNPERGVAVRRQIISKLLPITDALEKLPFASYDYSFVSSLQLSSIHPSIFSK